MRMRRKKGMMPVAMAASRNQSEGKKKISAAGGVVFSGEPKEEGPKVLLIFRRGVWDLPKGKQEGDETIGQCAVREVAEEVGLAHIPEIASGLTETYHEYEQQGTLYGKTTYWYAMPFRGSFNEEFQPQVEEDIIEVRWFTLQEARERVGYDNLKEVLQAFDQWYSRRE